MLKFSRVHSGTQFPGTLGVPVPKRKFPKINLEFQFPKGSSPKYIWSSSSQKEVPQNQSGVPVPKMKFPKINLEFQFPRELPGNSKGTRIKFTILKIGC
jgi:hypothetical protein